MTLSLHGYGQGVVMLADETAQVGTDLARRLETCRLGCCFLVFDGNVGALGVVL